MYGAIVYFCAGFDIWISDEPAPTVWLCWRYLGIGGQHHQPHLQRLLWKNSAHSPLHHQWPCWQATTPTPLGLWPHIRPLHRHWLHCGCWPPPPHEGPFLLVTPLCWNALLGQKGTHYDIEELVMFRVAWQPETKHHIHHSGPEAAY